MLRPHKSNSVEIVWSSNFTINERIYACILGGPRAHSGARKSRNGQKKKQQQQQKQWAKKSQWQTFALYVSPPTPVSFRFSPHSRRAVGFSRREAFVCVITTQKSSASRLVSRMKKKTDKHAFVDV